MAKPRKDENYDALGSIFDFIFKESKKPPDKRRPIKPTGIAGESMLTDALAATLEMPGAFITDNTINELNTALDLQLANVDFGSDYGKITVSTNNVADFIRDPEAFVDNVIKKGQGIRKAQRARFLGEFMDDYLTTAWAHKYGDLEVKKIALANASAGEKSEGYKIGRAIGQSTRGFDYKANVGLGKQGASDIGERNFMLNRSVDLLGSRTFGSRWNQMGNNEKDEFMRVLSSYKVVPTADNKDINVESPKIAEIQDYLQTHYGRTEAEEFAKALNYKAIDGRVNILEDVELYRFLENENVSERLRDLSNATPGAEEEKQKKIYEKTKLLLNLRTRGEIDKLEEMLKNPNLTNDQKDKIQSVIDDSNEVLKIVDGRGGDALLKIGPLVGKIGRWEGYINSLNNVYGGVVGMPNLVPSIINGSFFDVNRNTVCNPVEEVKINYLSKDEDQTFKIYRAKKGEKGKGARFINAYNEMGENLYYLTPRSIVRTLLFNGEGFVRLLDKNFDSIFALAKAQGLEIKKEDIVKGLMGETREDFESLLRDKLGNTIDKRKLDALLKGNKNLAGLSRVFSLNARIQGIVKKRVEKQMRRVRDKFANMLLNNKTLGKWLVKSGATKLLGQWVAKGGIQTLVKSLVTAVAGAAGMALTPLGSIAIMLLTGLITDLLFKLAKVLVGAAKLILLGVCGLIVVIILVAFGGGRKMNKMLFSYNNVIPGNVISCSAYGYGNVAPNPLNPIVPPRTQQECVLGSQGIYCSQGYIDVACWSHSSMQSTMPVDLTNVNYIYAPQFCDTGDCSIKEIRAINCGDGSYAGGIVVFDANDGSTTYTFKLLHVQALAAVGEKLSGGQPVALVQSNLEVGWCWTGKHLHLETRQNGQVVDPLELLQSFNCNVPDESGCSDSPAVCD